MDSERGSGGAVLEVTDLLIAHHSSPLVSSRLGRPSMNIRYTVNSLDRFRSSKQSSPHRSRCLRGWGSNLCGSLTYAYPRILLSPLDPSLTLTRMQHPAIVSNRENRNPIPMRDLQACAT